MPAVRCKECSFVAKENNGFCPDCGAMYVEPLEFVDESLAGKAAGKPLKPPKKKGGGLFASLFGSKSTEEENHNHHSSSVSSSAPPKMTQLPEGVPRDQIRIRCQECEHLTGIDAHEGYCPDCGAFFVDPVEYVTQESLAAEREALQTDIEKYKEVVKSFDEMSEAEKLTHLNEKVADTWDQIIKDRHVLNEKSNECMQCFTAAGTIKSEDQFEVMASMVKQRYVNLENFEIYFREYKQLLDDFNKIHDKLIEVRKQQAQQAQKVQQAQPAG